MPKLTIEFPSQEQLEVFASWLCGSGEQHYWDYDVGDGEALLVDFHYHGVEKTEYPHDDERRYGPFLADNTIRTTTQETD